MRKMTRSEHKVSIRDQAKSKVRPQGYDPHSQKDFREKVEAGYQQLLTSAAEGGDPKTKRIRGELIYLLNNYLPQYENRIQHLIDLWRRSGDPQYDPAVHVQARQARAEYLRKQSAL
ncbi:MAG: hypothetical protein HY706_11305 [Candidatus Hydrogenedentes bacterium]|nr:hypothetical protein [Candidatus Hydrogenedentota bacterium]